jgi:hypothetical protein
MQTQKPKTKMKRINRAGKVRVSMTLPNDLADLVSQIAKEQNSSVPYAIAELMKNGLSRSKTLEA